MHYPLTQSSRKSRLVRLGALGALGLAVLAAMGYAWLSHTGRHLDGAGPLGSGQNPGYESFAADPIGSASVEFTYGVTLCMVTGSEPAVIDSVSPDQTVGTGWRSLGMGVRVFQPSNGHQPIIGYWTYPPPPSVVPQTIHNVPGFAVSTPCSMEPSAALTEVLVGLGVVGTDGGGWRGIDVAYTVGGQHKVLFVNHDMLICGTSLPDRCRGPAVSPSP